MDMKVNYHPWSNSSLSVMTSLPVTGFGKVVIVREERELLGWDKGWKNRWKGSGRGSWGAGGVELRETRYMSPLVL